VNEGCHLFGIDAAKKNVRMLFYRMCYHYSLGKSKSQRKGIRIRFSKNQIRQLSKNMQILCSYSRLKVAKRKPVAKKSGENKKYLGKERSFSQNQMLDSFN
jgi:hypothetical protein